jgi:putative PEP-CTERM system histidine kinase
MSSSAILAFVAALFGGAMALAVAWQARRSMAHWSFAGGMLVLASESGFACLGLDTASQSVIQWETYRLMAASLLPGIWLLFSLSYARGNSAEFLRSWRFVIVAAFIVPIGLVCWFGEGLMAAQQVGPDQQWALVLMPPGLLLNLILLLTSVLVLMNLERTFRASVGTMRWRIKFMVVGLGVLFLVRAYSSSQALLFHQVDRGLEGVDAGALLVACPLIMRSLLRSGHFDVNVYPSHKVIHNSLILILAGAYLLAVGVLANIVKFVGTSTSFTLEAFILLMALVLLTILLLSDRVRLYTKRFVSRNFERPMYDYRTVWRRFTECTASRMDQLELCRATVKLVAEIFQVLSVTIWLVDEKKANLIFASSTSLSDVKGAELSPSGAEASEILSALQNQSDPVDIDASRENWAAALRRSHPDDFHAGSSRICVPMMMGGELLGVMTLGDRVGGIAFIHQDLDLLKCVGDQAAASLRNLQLSGKLLQVKEMEAFQAMSAFFVHDLKNTASSLGLMLKNLPIHFNDPAFREDALRGVSKTVSHINNLISRLSLLRHGLEIRRAEADLNEVVGKALAIQKGAIEIEIIKDFQTLPKISLDPEQILKVLTNLILNATEAVSKQGQLRITTSQTPGWAVLAVSDNGCGMTPEFLNRALFRPFQTTKKAGLGIGMFQSKMIIEAHGGRIEVDSKIGQGSTFRIFLPLNKK